MTLRAPNPRYGWPGRQPNTFQPGARVTCSDIARPNKPAYVGQWHRGMTGIILDGPKAPPPKPAKWLVQWDDATRDPATGWIYETDISLGID